MKLYFHFHTVYASFNAFIPLHFDKEPTNTVARKNEAVRLQCRVKGSPPASNFTWVKNGKVITVDHRVKVESNGALLINPVHSYKLDVGEYQCFASSSKFTIVSRKVRLEVAGKLRLQSMFLTHCGYFLFLAFLMAWSEQLQVRADYIVEREVCMSSPQRLNSFLNIAFFRLLMKISKRMIFKNGNRTLAFDTFNSGQCERRTTICFNRECTSAGQFRVFTLVLFFSCWWSRDRSLLACSFIFIFTFVTTFQLSLSNEQRAICLKTCLQYLLTRNFNLSMKRLREAFAQPEKIVKKL